MNYKVQIVDDEEPARELLLAYAGRLAELEVVSVETNALAAKKWMEQHPVDILLTDIHMEDLTGIDLVKLLKDPPIVIFTTAYSEYALEGYELDVADYLVKPISFLRFSKAIDKAKELIDFQRTKKEGLLASAQTDQKDFFFVRTNRKMVKVKYQEILFVESYGEYVKIYTSDDVFLALQRTSFMEAMLPDSDFIRIHRSHIINLNYIQEIDGNTVILEGKHRLTVSKRQKDNFMKTIQDRGVI